MDLFWTLLSLVIRFLLFFTVVRNIASHKAYGWDVRDYSGMVLVALVLVWGWFSSMGAGRVVITLFLTGTIVSAAFEGLGNRKAALISAMAALSLLIVLFLGITA